MLGLNNCIVVSYNHLVDLVQFSELDIIIPLHVCKHVVEGGGQLVDSLFVGALEFLVHFLDSIYINLFDFQILDVAHILYIFYIINI